MGPMLQTSHTRSRKHPLYCSFCGKNDAEVGYLISGPCVFICNECVEVSREIGAQMVIDEAVRRQASEK